VLGVAPKVLRTVFAPAVPNLFTRATQLAFLLVQPGRAGVFSIERVRTLASRLHDAGAYRLQWNGTDSGHPLAAGVWSNFTRVVTCLK
jgi:hypothetical protein